MKINMNHKVHRLFCHSAVVFLGARGEQLSERTIIENKHGVRIELIPAGALIISSHRVVLVGTSNILSADLYTAADDVIRPDDEDDDTMAVVIPSVPHAPPPPPLAAK